MEASMQSNYNYNCKNDNDNVITYYYLKKYDYETQKSRALYKHKYLSRYYRQSYPLSPTDNSKNNLKLYITKSLKSAIDMRMTLFEYCGEIYDVYVTHAHNDTTTYNSDDDKLLSVDEQINIPLPNLYVIDYYKLLNNIYLDDSGQTFSLSRDDTHNRLFKQGTVLKAVKTNRYYGAFNKDWINRITLIVKSTNRFFCSYNEEEHDSIFNTLLEKIYPIPQKHYN